MTTKRKIPRAVQRRTNRLLRLARILQDMPRGELDMRQWGRHSLGHDPVEQNYCGTALCALGAAGVDPQFNRAGLSLGWENYNGLWWAGPRYKRAVETDAGALFFGLTGDEAMRAFRAYDENDRVREDKAEIIGTLLYLAYFRAEAQR